MKKINILSKTGFFLVGFIFAVGSGVVFSTWTPSEKNSLDPLYKEDWNQVAKHASSWERMQNGNVLLNVNGNVGIGGNPSNSAKLHVFGDTTTSNLNIDGGYLKLHTTNGVPIYTDCDTPDEVGRMIVDKTNAGFYVCLMNSQGLIQWTLK